MRKVKQKWENQAALGAHAASAHMAGFGARAKELSTNVAVHTLQAV